MYWPVADPSDILDYCLDIAAWLADAGETVVAFDASASPADGSIQVVSSTVVGGVLTVRIGGGIPGTVYQIGLTVTLGSGERLHRSVALPVAALSSVPLSFPPDTLTVNQLPLTVGSYDMEAG
jgi:hypothetical protein